MREALLVGEVTLELAAATFVEFAVREAYTSGLERGVDVSGGGLLAYDKDLGPGGSWQEGESGEEDSSGGQIPRNRGGYVIPEGWPSAREGLHKHLMPCLKSCTL
jgi:hypothetical protein